MLKLLYRNRNNVNDNSRSSRSLSFDFTPYSIISLNSALVLDQDCRFLLRWYFKHSSFCMYSTAGQTQGWSCRKWRWWMSELLWLLFKQHTV